MALGSTCAPAPLGLASRPLHLPGTSRMPLPQGPGSRARPQPKGLEQKWGHCTSATGGPRGGPKELGQRRLSARQHRGGAGGTGRRHSGSNRFQPGALLGGWRESTRRNTPWLPLAVVMDSEQSLGTEQLFASAARKGGRAKGRATGVLDPSVTAGE